MSPNGLVVPAASCVLKSRFIRDRWAVPTMAEYFLCLDAETFLKRIRPAFAGSWRLRSFEPCRSLCKELLPAARDYTQRYHLGEEETLVAQVAGGVPFDRAVWRLLVGEVLLFAAVEIPEFQSNSEALCCLLAPEQFRRGVMIREQFAPIQQVLRGSRDLTFGAAVYRPDQAGYNDPEDVARLAAFLAAVQPQNWTVDDLRALPELCDDDERSDELAFVREWFPVLVDLYRRTRVEQRVLIIESIY
ncbi:MAG TPA: hypothetical protein VE999_08150 [Gemmataceae bacterium]|nr:hypothetical protein [Gemmataceae bacterium]